MPAWGRGEDARQIAAIACYKFTHRWSRGVVADSVLPAGKVLALDITLQCCCRGQCPIARTNNTALAILKHKLNEMLKNDKITSIVSSTSYRSNNAASSKESSCWFFLLQLDLKLLAASTREFTRRCVHQKYKCHRKLFTALAHYPLHNHTLKTFYVLRNSGNLRLNKVLRWKSKGFKIALYRRFHGVGRPNRRRTREEVGFDCKLLLLQMYRLQKQHACGVYAGRTGGEHEIELTALHEVCTLTWRKRL